MIYIFNVQHVVPASQHEKRSNEIVQRAGYISSKIRNETMLL